MASDDDLRLETENLDLRRLLAQAGIHAAEQKVAERLQRVLLEELHHRVKNTLATVLAITSQSLRTAASLEHGKQAIEKSSTCAGARSRSAVADKLDECCSCGHLENSHCTVRSGWSLSYSKLKC